MAFLGLLELLGEDVQDPEEESFLLFTQALPSQNLGFVDPKATSIDLTVAGRDITVQQSPAGLSSNRSEGTTGAVLWRVSPLFADWVSCPENPLISHSILRPDSLVLELGCGITGIVGLALAPKIGRYVATDQEHLLNILKRNVSENTIRPKAVKPPKKSDKVTARSKGQPEEDSNIEVIALDWELSLISSLPDLLGGTSTIDVLIGCDCVYNEALIDPFVRTCTEICELRSQSGQWPPTVCLVAQQLRSPDVFEAWAKAFHKSFRFWRMPDKLLHPGLRTNSGYVIHLGVLRQALAGKLETLVQKKSEYV
ncbi:hypothetical protein MMC11_004108 [Xylographa trunciseda]|nr:hypothetical protein [Xylographa trunciseda]